MRPIGPICPISLRASAPRSAAGPPPAASWASVPFSLASAPRVPADQVPGLVEAARHARLAGRPADHRHPVRARLPLAEHVRVVGRERERPGLAGRPGPGRQVRRGDTGQFDVLPPALVQVGDDARRRLVRGRLAGHRGRGLGRRLAVLASAAPDGGQRQPEECDRAASCVPSLTKWPSRPGADRGAGGDSTAGASRPVPGR